MILSLAIIGIAIAIEPIPLLTFIVVLSSKGGVRKGAAFIFGWLLSIAVVLAATVLVTGNKPPKPNTAPSLAAIVVKLLIGVGLVAIAIRQRRRIGLPKKPPKWQTGADSMSPWFAMALGPLVQPWGLVAAGVAVVVEAKLASWQTYLVLFLFCVLATSSYLAMELYAGLQPEKTQAFLVRARTWIESHTDQVIIIASLVAGFWLVGDSIYLLVN